MRKSAAEWHATWLFKPSLSGESKSVNHFVQKLSENLEYLQSATGHESLLLVVDPANDDDDDLGFVGGTSMGQSFWNGLRGGGTLGSRQFKQQCRSLSSSVEASSLKPKSAPEGSVTGNRQSPTVVLKNNLYNEMRAALRLASGNSTAEMKWSKPEKLATLGVQLVGWPSSVPFKNPSRMSQQEIMLIRNLLHDNVINFVRVGSGFETNEPNAGESSTQSFEPAGSASTVTRVGDPPEIDMDMSWALQDDDTLDACEKISSAVEDSMIVSTQAFDSSSNPNDTRPPAKRQRRQSDS